MAAPAPFMAMPAPPLTTAASGGDTAEAAAATATEGVAAALAALPLVAGLGTGGGCTGRDVPWLAESATMADVDPADLLLRMDAALARSPLWSTSPLPAPAPAPAAAAAPTPPPAVGEGATAAAAAVSVLPPPAEVPVLPAVVAPGLEAGVPRRRPPSAAPAEAPPARPPVGAAGGVAAPTPAPAPAPVRCTVGPEDLVAWLCVEPAWCRVSAAVAVAAAVEALDRENHSDAALARADDTYTSRRARRLSGSGSSSTSFGNRTQDSSTPKISWNRRK